VLVFGCVTFPMPRVLLDTDLAPPSQAGFFFGLSWRLFYWSISASL
jgi:hypothetical protein